MEADQGEVMVRAEADQGESMAKEPMAKVKPDQCEAMVKVDVHQDVDDKRERALEEEDTWGFSNWMYIAFCVDLCFLFFTSGDYENKNYVNNFDTFMYIYLSIFIFNGSFFCLGCLGWEDPTGDLEEQRTGEFHIPRNHDFRAYTLYFPYYLSTVLIMILLADTQGSLYCCGGLSLMLVLYGFDLSNVILGELTMCDGRFYTTKFMKFVYGSVFVAVLTFVLMRYVAHKQ